MKFDLKTIFRRLLVAQILLLVAFVATDIFFIDQLPPELVRYNEVTSERELQNPVMIVLPAVYSIGFFGSIILLWRFINVGRFIYTAVVLTGAISSIGMTPQVFHQFSVFCEYLSTLITGIIIGLMYFSELSGEFREDRA